MTDILIMGLFATWTAVSVLVYLPRLHDAVRRHDRLLLIPEWRFFAPNPGQHDVHLLFRDKYEDGTCTAWTEILAPERRRPLDAVFHVRRRTSKALFDCTEHFARHVSASDPALTLSIPYLTLLNYVSRLPRSHPPAWTQFAIMHSDGDSAGRTPQAVFVSGLHRLPA